MDNNLKEEILYTTDKLAKAEYLKTEYKKHEKWKKRENVRIVLAVISTLALPMAIMGALEDANYDFKNFNIKLFVIGLIGLGIVLSIPYIFYYKKLKQTCSEGIDKIFNEHIYISDNFIRYIKSHRKNESNYFYGEEIEYKFIRRIIYDQERSRLYIYGKKKEIAYKNYSKNKNDFTWRGNKNFKAHIRLIMFYKANENIIETLRRYSPVQMEFINNFNPDFKKEVKF